MFCLLKAFGYWKGKRNSVWMNVTKGSWKTRQRRTFQAHVCISFFLCTHSRSTTKIVYAHDCSVCRFQCFTGFLFLFRFVRNLIRYSLQFVADIRKRATNVKCRSHSIDWIFFKSGSCKLYHQVKGINCLVLAKTKGPIDIEIIEDVFPFNVNMLSQSTDQQFTA